MILGHTIALDPTEAQAAHFRHACGVARFAYNWGLEHWQEMHKSGGKPTTYKVRAAWNAVRHEKFPWSAEVNSCIGAQAIFDLGAAFANFIRDAKKPKCARRFRFPRFKSKRLNNGFALWNDRIKFDEDRIRVPSLGWVKMREALRFEGKILGARISRTGTRWCVSVHVETDGTHPSAPEDVVGVDLGVATLMTLSKPLPDGRVEIPNPRARGLLLNRQRKLARRISRQKMHQRKGGEKISRRQTIRSDRLRKLHCRIASIRKDAIHKATTSIANAYRTVVLEDLNVSGMAKSQRLAGAVLDASFREIRRCLEYKVMMRGGRVVIADRFFPSSKACSACGTIADAMPLRVREWTCLVCDTHHDRDKNAAKNLELVVRAGCPEPSGCGRQDTRGEISALAFGKPKVKRRSMNRELEYDLATDR